MTVHKILTYGDQRLRTPSKEVYKISSKIHRLVEDLLETMYSYDDGVGLAAPQIGVNYRVFVLDTAVEGQSRNPIAFINPKIIKKWGAYNSFEGCLSFPGVYTYVKRYANVIIRARDIKGKIFTLEAKDGSLLARAIQHEYDHLDGVLFADHTRNRLETDQLLAEKGLPHTDPDYLLEEKELEKELQEQEAKIKK